MIDKRDVHTFVVCAYKESPFLEDCLRSLAAQTVQSSVLMATSTPNDYLRDLAAKYGVDLFIRDGMPDIADDWNYAVSCAKTPYVTIAHQDDVYESTYAEKMVNEFSSNSDGLLFFTDYGEIRDGEQYKRPILASVKKCLLLPYALKRLRSSRFWKRAPLALGNPICCPAVTYNVDRLPSPLFVKGFRSNLDWDAWERFSRLGGSFLYCPEIGMYHRVHAGSETSSCIVDDVRVKEDLAMLERFWPKPIAGWINRFYKKAQSFN